MMVANVKNNKYKKMKRLLLPVSVSRGITIEQKQAEDKTLELMAWKKHRKESKTFTMKKFNNYFLNQERISSSRR